MRVVSLTDRGSREYNADSVHVGRSLFVVADGVGGSPHACTASQIVCDVLASSEPQLEDLPSVVMRAHSKVKEAAEKAGSRHMASTVVAALIQDDELICTHAGDSKLFLLRQGLLSDLTPCHNVETELRRAGNPNADKLAPRVASMITRYMGQEDTPVLETTREKLRPKDRILLCTDGIWNQIPRAELQLMMGLPRPEKMILEAALAHPSSDNATLIFLGR